MFKYLTLPKDSPNLDKDTIWKKLVDEGMMAPVKTSNADKATIDALQTEAAKHKSMEVSAVSIGQKLFNSGDAPPKRRKLLSKRSEIRV